MSHNVETMAYAGEVPWHGLGVKVPNDLTPEQMMDSAGLNWQVNKVPAVAEWRPNEFVETGKSALIRSSDNKVLDVVSDDWNPVQNAEAFGFFYEFIMSGQMEMHTAGSLKGGEIVWALAKTNQSFELFGKDRVDSYLLFTNPHQYGKSIDIRFTPIRVVCNNTLTLALNKKGKSDFVVRLNHRNAFDADMVKNVMGLASVKLEGYKETATFLSEKKLTKTSVHDYLNELFPVTGKKDKEYSRPAETVIEVMDKQPGAEYGKGTFWQLFNAVTYATDHVLGNSTDTRLRSAWYGENRKRKIKALELAVEHAEKA